MAGLLLKELKIRGLVKRTLIVTPANLSFQWQREMKDKFSYRIGRIPCSLWPIGGRLEPRFGKLGREYRQIVFDKALLSQDATSEWITPGHPLFEVVREDVLTRVQEDLQRGSVFYDLHGKAPYRVDVFSAAIKDGRGHVLHRTLFGVQAEQDGTMAIKQPTLFLDLSLAPQATIVPVANGLPDRQIAERILIEQGLIPLLTRVAVERERETKTISDHLEISLHELLSRQNLKLAELMEQRERGDTTPLLTANLKRAEDRVDELVDRLESRREELQQERQCTIGDIQHIGRAWVLPHPERTAPGIAPMVRDEEIERIAVEAVTTYEVARGWQVESVEKDNRGFDLISRKPHSEDPKTAIEVRFIEVKGRAAVGEVALTTNEYKTAERLKQDYWLYTVFNCASVPEMHVIQDPIRLGWKPVQKIEHYHVGAEQILAAEHPKSGKR